MPLQGSMPALSLLLHTIGGAVDADGGATSNRRTVIAIIRQSHMVVKAGTITRWSPGIGIGIGIGLGLSQIC